MQIGVSPDKLNGGGELYTISNIQGICGIEKEIISFLQFEMWIAFSVLVNEPKSCQSLENKIFFWKTEPDISHIWYLTIFELSPLQPKYNSPGKLKSSLLRNNEFPK